MEVKEKVMASIAAAAAMFIARSAHATPSYVACIGDSITQGVGASSSSTDWVSDLGGLLGSSVMVGNYGVSGTTMMMQSNSSYWGTGDLQLVESFVTNAGASASVAVIIMLGTNDSKDNPSGVDNWTSTAPMRYAADYNSMIDDLVALTPSPQVFLALPPPAFTNSYDIDGTVIANQIVPIIMGIAADRQLPVIDVHSALAGMSTLFPDGVHPNDMGHMVIATTMQNGLLSPTIPALDGGLVDASPPVDSAAMTDAVAPLDASIAIDASVAIDGSSIRSNDGGGVVDASDMPERDAEQPTGPGARTGCGCTTAGSSATMGPVWLATAILGAFRLRRRRSVKA